MLNLFKNQIDDEGVQHLAAALQHNTVSNIFDADRCYLLDTNVNYRR